MERTTLGRGFLSFLVFLVTILYCLDIVWFKDLSTYFFCFLPIFDWEFVVVATYPSAGGRRVTRGMRVPRKEYARSRHQRLFEENVGKTGKDVIYEL